MLDVGGHFGVMSSVHRVLKEKKGKAPSNTLPEDHSCRRSQLANDCQLWLDVVNETFA